MNNPGCTYIVFHTTNMETSFSPVLDQPRKYAGCVTARGVSEAFVKSQNDFNESWRQLRQRSTSVGDILVRVNGDGTVTGFLSTGWEFKEVDLPQDIIQSKEVQFILHPTTGKKELWARMGVNIQLDKVHYDSREELETEILMKLQAIQRFLSDEDITVNGETYVPFDHTVEILESLGIQPPVDLEEMTFNL